MTCTATEAGCRCHLDPHEDGPHVCACGGSWQHHDDGSFTIHAPPGTADGYDMHPLAHTIDYPITFPSEADEPSYLDQMLAAAGLFVPPGGYVLPRDPVRFVEPPALDGG